MLMYYSFTYYRLEERKIKLCIPTQGNDFNSSKNISVRPQGMAFIKSIIIAGEHIMVM